MTTIEQNISPYVKFFPRMSEDQYERWALASEGQRSEWVEGEVILISPANIDHEDLIFWLSGLIGFHVAKSNLGKVHSGNTMVRIPGRRRVPDLLFVANDRLSNFTRTYLQGPPNLAVEVVSPDSESRDWRVKYLEYQAAGINEYWIIDPASGTAEFYQLVNAAYQPIPTPEGLFHSPQLPGFWLKLDWLTQRPLPNLLETAKTIGII